jgi:acetyl esterase/lipase
MDAELAMAGGAHRDRRGAVVLLRNLVYNPKYSPEAFRERLERAFYSPFLPRQVAVQRLQAGSVGFDLLLPEVYAKNRLIFYVHGGSLVGGSSRAWRPFCASLADECAARLVLTDFRLAPSFTFPTALDDLQAVFREVYNKLFDGARNDPLLPLELIIAGDSSGASLAMALALNLREHIRVHVKTLILFSPWVDLSPSSIFRGTKKRIKDEVITPRGYEVSVDSYTYLSNLENPLVSPVYSTPALLTGFPPVYIQMGGRELLMVDVLRFVRLLRDCGVPCTLDVWEDMMHLFQMADQHLDESHRAIKKIGRYARTNEQ